MPRAFSSGSRSVSTPVSARTSAVLPWSMWPAVPTIIDGARDRGTEACRGTPPRPRGSAGRARSAPSSMRPDHRARGSARSAGAPARLERARRAACRPDGSASAALRQRLDRQRAAADLALQSTTSTVKPRARPRRRRRAARRSARARIAAARAGQQAQRRQAFGQAVGVAVEPQRRLQRGEADLVEPQRALQRVLRAGARPGRCGRR